MVTSSSENEHEMSVSIHMDSKGENGLDNSTNDSEKDSIESNSIETEPILNYEMSDSNIQNILWKTWDAIFSLLKEEDIKGRWCAIIYKGKEVPHTFIALLQKIFRADSNGPVEVIECVCLK